MAVEIINIAQYGGGFVKCNVYKILHIASTIYIKSAFSVFVCQSGVTLCSSTTQVGVLAPRNMPPICSFLEH